jgi:hypothetical protein
MTINVKAIYKRGMLDKPLPFPEDAEVSVTVVAHEERNAERPQGMGERSWDAVTQLLAECAIDTGIPDFARNHDRYLYGRLRTRHNGLID